MSYCSAVATADLEGHYATAYTYQGSNNVEVQTWTLAPNGTYVFTNGYVYLTLTC